jgi:hypothetical protein
VTAQRSLFAEEDPLEEEYATARSLAARLPRGLRLGTSSWSFPGWSGIVYRGDHSEAWLAREGLAHYAQHPLFGTVGIDRSYYAAVPDETWSRYASQLPAGFRCCIKAPATVTSAVMPGSDHGARAGVANPDFLSPIRFAAEMGDRLNAHFAAHTGVVMLEVPRAGGVSRGRAEGHTLRRRVA